MRPQRSSPFRVPSMALAVAREAESEAGVSGRLSRPSSGTPDIVGSVGPQGPAPNNGANWTRAGALTDFPNSASPL